MTAPLPEGWKFFRSYVKTPMYGPPPHWYAVAPYHIANLPVGEGRGKLDQTVSAPTWAELHRLVDEQVRQYQALMP